MPIKKCAGDAATSHSAIAMQSGSNSCLDEIISSFIPHGKDNAIKMSALAAALHTSEREVRKIIHEARCNGAVIIGDNNGYYLPCSQEELLPYYITARKRSASGLKALRAAKRKLEKFKGQQCLSDL